MSGLHKTLPALRVSSFTAASRCALSRPDGATIVRPFSTTHVHQRRHAKKQLFKDHKDVPEYPYGPARLYKKANFGLYGGKRVRFGNIVSDGKWVKKTRRKWWPNVQQRNLYSEGLDRKIDLKVTTSVLRTIDKVGGLDNYLLGSTSARIKELGMKGWKLRWELLQQPNVQDKFKEERLRLGLRSEDFEDQLGEVQALQNDFKRQYAQQSVEQRSKAYFEKRTRNDIWGKSVVTHLESTVASALKEFGFGKFSSEQKSRRNTALHKLQDNDPQLFQDMKETVSSQLLTKRA